MHHVYQTKAYVIRSFPFGEYNKKVLLLSENFGVIWANVQAIRKVESKLRLALVDFSLADVALVFGKQGWKIVNAVSIENFFYTLSADKSIILIRILNLIYRMVPEEERESRLFHLVKELESFLISGGDDCNLDFLETITVLKILKVLGYVGDDQIIEKYLEAKPSPDQDFDSQKERSRCLEVINLAIKESHL